MSASSKISPQVEQRVPEGGYKRVCVCVCVCKLVIYHSCTWTRSLFCNVRLGKHLSWMAGVQTSRLCCWQLMENHHLCQATCQVLPATPLLLPHPRHHQPAGLGLTAITFGEMLSRGKRHLNHGGFGSRFGCSAQMLYSAVCTITPYGANLWG